MMISPEFYYEKELKGKTPEELRTEIRLLKGRMTELKKKMKHPDYQPALVCPSDDTVLYWTGKYLAMAKKALAEAGEEYQASSADRKRPEHGKETEANE